MDCVLEELLICSCHEEPLSQIYRVLRSCKKSCFYQRLGCLLEYVIHHVYLSELQQAQIYQVTVEHLVVHCLPMIEDVHISNHLQYDYYYSPSLPSNEEERAI